MHSYNCPTLQLESESIFRVGSHREIDLKEAARRHTVEVAERPEFSRLIFRMEHPKNERKNIGENAPQG